MELMSCPSMAVPAEVMHHVVRVESSYNPYAIGVVGGRLVRQPDSLPEALATVRMLESKGYNFSLGLAQVNRYNLGKYGLESYEKAFQACPNLQAGSRILAECHSRSGGDWGKSFSCYYSGNFVTGYRHGYVQKIYASMHKSGAVAVRSPELAIPVTGNPSRRTAEVTRYPVYDAQQSSGRVLQTNIQMRNITAQSASSPNLARTTPPEPGAALFPSVPSAPQLTPLLAESGVEISDISKPDVDEAFVF
jgi:type IV secretion system protein VirB1